MLASRRVSQTCARLTFARRYASLETTSAATASAALPPPSPEPKTLDSKQLDAEATPVDSEAITKVESRPSKGQQRTRRPYLSLENPRDWNRPLAKGVLPAYDHALSYILADSEALTEELKTARTTLEALESVSESEQNTRAIEELREKVRILDIQSQINLPSVRWKAANGMADMHKPIYRHLIEQRWREEGTLDLLMERIHQMNVVPDLLPSLHPSLDLRINFPDIVPETATRRARVKRRYQKVTPGVFLQPEQTRRPPMLYTTVFHTDTRLYTLFMVDLDVPDPENQSFTTYLHWMQPNLALSAFSPSPIPLSTSHTRYIPPHPQCGTPYHRYVILLVPQTQRIHVPVPPDEERLGFNYRAFAEQYGLDASKGGGAHMWREVWNKAVSQIYADVLKIEEPKFGRPPKEDPYAQLKSTKKYI